MNCIKADNNSRLERLMIQTSYGLICAFNVSTSVCLIVGLLKTSKKLTPYQKLLVALCINSIAVSAIQLTLLVYNRYIFREEEVRCYAVYIGYFLLYLSFVVSMILVMAVTLSRYTAIADSARLAAKKCLSTRKYIALLMILVVVVVAVLYLTRFKLGIRKAYNDMIYNLFFMIILLIYVSIILSINKELYVHIQMHRRNTKKIIKKKQVGGELRATKTILVFSLVFGICIFAKIIGMSVKVFSLWKPGFVSRDFLKWTFHASNTISFVNRGLEPLIIIIMTNKIRKLFCLNCTKATGLNHESNSNIRILSYRSTQEETENYNQ